VGHPAENGLAVRFPVVCGRGTRIPIRVLVLSKLLDLTWELFTGNCAGIWVFAPRRPGLCDVAACASFSGREWMIEGTIF
jgi:hypothetical protein